MGVKGIILLLLILFLIFIPMSGSLIRSDYADNVSEAAFANRGELPTVKAKEIEPGKIPLINQINNELNIQDNTENTDHLLTLLSFNIHSANDIDGNVKLDEIIEEIRDTNAEIIGLQEVERLMPRSGYKDQAKTIAEALGFYYYYGSNINILGVQYGNAFLSKYPILEAKNNKLPKELLEPRGFIEALIDVEGTSYNIFITHLGLSASEREKQISEINLAISKKEGNIILMGDFNGIPSGAEMSSLDSQMIDTAKFLEQDEDFTFPLYNEQPSVRIDRIYTSNNITIVEHEIKPSQISDHVRVIARVNHVENK